MSIKLCPVWVMLLLLLIASVHQTFAQESRFFRIAGPAATKITAFRSDGWLVWSNALAGTNYTIQTVGALPGGSNWVDYVELPVTQNVNSNQIVSYNPPAGMAFVPAGLFRMGDTLDSESDAMPTNIYVSAFYMDVNLVSFDLWQSVYTYATNRGYGFGGGFARGTNYPVEGVYWYDAVKWSNARSAQSGLTPVYYTDAGLTQVYTNGNVTPYAKWSANGFRLPTEAEWEKAARGGLNGKRFPWGNTITESQANYFSGHGPFYDSGPYDGFNTNFDGGILWPNQNTFTGDNTGPVGFFAPNGYGLYDMAGNLFEWCLDWYATPYGQPTTNNPTGPAGPLSDRVLRGGNWLNYAQNARCAYRLNSAPNNVYVGVGFRCVKAL